IDQLPKRLRRWVVFEDERIAARPGMVADRCVILAADGQAVAPIGPELRLVVLARKVLEIDGRSRLSNRDSFAKRRGRLQEIGRRVGDDLLAAGQSRREGHGGDLLFLLLLLPLLLPGLAGGIPAT